MKRLLVAVALIAAPGPASAQPPKAPAPQAGPKDPKEEALARWKRGMELYEEQDFNAALIEFRKAYETAPSYKVLYNIGQVCFQMTDYACALRSFEQYLKDGAGQIATERKQQVERDIERLQSRIGKLEIVTNVDGVDLSIDDVYIGKTPLPAAIVVSAGKRKITATKDGRVPVTRIVEVAGTDSMRVELMLADASGKPDGPAQPGPAPSRWTTLSWVGVGVAGGLAVTGGVLGLMALGASNDLEDKRFVGTQTSPDVKDQESKVKTLALASDIVLGAAAATLVTTLILTYVRTPRAEAKVSLGVGPGVVVVGGGF